MVEIQQIRINVYRIASGDETRIILSNVYARQTEISAGESILTANVNTEGVSRTAGTTVNGATIQTEHVSLVQLALMAEHTRIAGGTVRMVGIQMVHVSHHRPHHHRLHLRHVPTVEPTLIAGVIANGDGIRTEVASLVLHVNGEELIQTAILVQRVNGEEPIQTAILDQVVLQGIQERIRIVRHLDAPMEGRIQIVGHIASTGGIQMEHVNLHQGRYVDLPCRRHVSHHINNST